MPGQHTIQNVTFKSAGAAIRANRFVTQVGAETCKEADAAGQAAYGVAMAPIQNPNMQGLNEITLPKAIAVMDTGTAWVVAGAAIAINAQVSTDNQGRAKTAVATEVVLGTARSAAAAAGDLVLVALDTKGGSIKA